MRTLAAALVVCGSIAAFVACGGDKQEAKSPDQTETKVTATKTDEASSAAPATTAGPADSAEPAKKEEAPPPAPKKSAKDIVTAGGTFMFSLADSPDAKKAADDDCAKKAKKDDKKLEACKKDAETAAAGEGVRFEKDDKGDWWWISFGTEKGKEVVYNKVKFNVASGIDDKVTLAPTGKDLGKKPMKTMPKEMVIETPDENTVVMTDPKKGKLTFKKK